MRTTTMLAAMLTTIWTPSAGAQAPNRNWLDVARHLGGSGSSSDGRYVLQVPGAGWEREATPPVWLEFSGGVRGGLLRGTIPLLRPRCSRAVRVLREELPKGACVVVSDTFGASSSRVHVRFMANGKPAAVARRLRAALERIEPGALSRVKGTGVVRKDTFECENSWSIVRSSGEVLVVEKLPDAFRREGTHVRFAAHRRPGGREQFYYYGVVNHWRSVVILKSAAKVEKPPRRARPPQDPRSWIGRCEKHARALLARKRPEKARRNQLIASGFVELGDPGYFVCPTCSKALEKTWLFADSTHDRVEATLHCCTRDALYFLSRRGHGNGPFHPELKKENR